MGFFFLDGVYGVGSLFYFGVGIGFEIAIAIGTSIVYSLGTFFFFLLLVSLSVFNSFCLIIYLVGWQGKWNRGGNPKKETKFCLR